MIIGIFKLCGTGPNAVKDQNQLELEVMPELLLLWKLQDLEQMIKFASFC